MAHAQQHLAALPAVRAISVADSQLKDCISTGVQLQGALRTAA